MTIDLDWWALPVFVLAYGLFLTRRLIMRDLFAMVVAGSFCAGMGLVAALLTVLVWGITR
ncbi:hypothetical protein [Marinobacter salarius]|uniref:Uncharacterized protein n=1 Tax=Marinobacter salarius TaxID=1420917 RepID=A0A1W6K987_9GAMM|nr:hypothetical protein [Marinobacter salarius]ARM83970.1 hypothetical protein MARSALSMR5_01892 [Marinobacter salarius]